MTTTSLRARSLARVLIALLPAILLGACAHKHATAPPPAPVNHDPIISSMWAFPDNIGPQDSMIVVCIASDSDGDTLVYDWLSDGRFIIKGLAPGDNDLYSSPSNSQVFYLHVVLPSDTTGWVSCHVRDQKGGGDSRQLIVRVHP